MSQKSRKIRAIAAGGAVLGVGAAITLAAWSDNEFAQGSFGAGSFDIQGSATGAEGDWASHTTSDAALQLAFGEDGAAANLAPGVPVYNQYHLRNAGTVPAHISYGATTTGALDLDTDISYGMVTADTCDAEGFAAGTPVEAGTEFTLAPNTRDSYCFQVVLQDGYDAAAAEAGNIVWAFEANQEPAAAGAE